MVFGERMWKFRWLVFSISVVAVVTMFGGCSKSYSRMMVDGKAMLPNFKDGDQMLIENGEVTINRGDVIIFYFPMDRTKVYFKRVVGLPGENIKIQAGRVFINDLEIVEPYLDEKYNKFESYVAEMHIPKGSYFVLGDNRDNSSDSRSWGMVNKDLVIGKYVTTLWHSKESARS